LIILFVLNALHGFLFKKAVTLRFEKKDLKLKKAKERLGMEFLIAFKILLLLPYPLNFSLKDSKLHPPIYVMTKGTDRILQYFNLLKI